MLYLLAVVPDGPKEGWLLNTHESQALERDGKRVPFSELLESERMWTLPEWAWFIKFR